MKTIVYVDAFNLYFGALKGSGKIVGVINPQRRPCKPLRDHATFYRQSIRDGVLGISRFPSALTDAQGQFHKPPSW